VEVFATILFKRLIKKFKLLGFKDIVLETHSRTYRNGKDDLFTRFNTYANEHQEICLNCCTKTYNV